MSADEQERRFQADLEKAIALSLETSEFERLRLEQRKKSIIEATGWRNRPSNGTPLAVSPNNVAPLPPPPGSSAGRRQSTQTDHTDLISFHSPTKPEDSFTKNDLEQFLTPISNHNALLPSSTQKTEPPGIGFRRDLLLRQNPFPQPAPILNFRDSPQPYQRNFSTGSYSPYTHSFTPVHSSPQPNNLAINYPQLSPFLSNNPAPSYPTPFSSPQNPPPSLYPSLSFPPNGNPPYVAPLPSPSSDINALYSQPVKKTPQNSPSLQSLASTKSVSKKDNANLIDLTPEKNIADTATVLEAFDPLAPAPCNDDGSSIYGTYDPFDYMAGGSQGDAVYAEVPAPPTEENEELTKKQITAEWIRTGLVFDSSRVVRPELSSSSTTSKGLLERVPPWTGNAQLEAFCTMISDLRSSFRADDTATNAGLLLSPTVDCDLPNAVNVKLVVSSPGCSSSATFTCDLSTSIEHVTSHVVCELEGELGGATAADYVLKVDGASEYLAGASTLADYEYVYQCIKMDRDVALILVPAASLNRSLARTAQDDKEDVSLLPQHLLPAHLHQHPISYETLSILLETVEGEMERLTQAARQLSSGGASIAPRFSPRSVEQAVKALCSLMGQLETLEITHALKELAQAFEIAPRPVTVLEDRGAYSTVSVDQTVSRCCEAVREAVYSLIHSYCGAFNVDFRLSGAQTKPDSDRTRSIEGMYDPVLVHVGALHRPSVTWKYTRYLVEAQVFHGTRAMRCPYRSSPCPLSRSFYDRVAFNAWLSLDDVPLAMLPREARIVIALFGLQPLAPEHELSKMHPGVPQYEKIELGWAAVQCFDHEGLLAQGRMLLSVWPVAADKRMGPAPEPGTHPLPSHPVLEIALPGYDPRPVFLPPKLHDAYDCPDLDSLDHNTQQLLLDVCAEDTFSKTVPEDREILWEKRHYLVDIPQALPKVLLAATAWDAASLPDLHRLLRRWARMTPLAALQLLLPCFPDMAVRSLAISCLRELSPDELVDYLPQLVQALKNETYEANPLARCLLEQALTSPRVAHHLFWLLVQILPGDNPQNSSEAVDGDMDKPENLAEYRYHWRLRILLRGLLAVSGSAMRLRLCSQLNLVKSLYDAAQRLKQCKESIRVRSLLSDLEMLHHNLQEEPAGLPLSASVAVRGVQVRTCSYFPSKTLPLKIDFLSDEGQLVPAIFKVGDDLRQDSLTLQMIRVMDKLWLKAGLDLRMVTFACVPTGSMRGMIELVTNAETLRKIQTEHGLTGSFKDRPIAEWLAKHNPGALEYARAVNNFTASCAGYSVATYVLGICDRHNDNIMLNTTGHLFHIDFGKFLGDAQMFGNFKRDRAPFVLTSDMAYVINGGDRPAQSFQQFVDLCCQAFHVVRQHSNVILNMLGFMVGAGIPGVTLDSMRYVQRALLPGQSRAEASASFSRLIESALSSWFTQFNFFLHNLSQLRASGDREGGTDLFSFVPKIHTCEEDGRIIGTQVHNVQKRYGTEKHYVYVIRVDREGQPGPSYIFRTYREFCELHNKICALFPLAKVYSLQAGLQIGRSAVKQVAERRKVDIEKFLVSLFKMADEVAHSDAVYTFFHPLLRDQEDVSIDQRKVKNAKREEATSRTLSGQLKLTLMYQRGTFSVMVAHARGLAKVGGGQEPSTYVKVYLLPDAGKHTKRKTKVVRRNCHPTFMEMLEYRMALDVVRSRFLQATVWSYDSLQENEFLGGFMIPLENIAQGHEVSEWYPLGNVTRG